MKISQASICSVFFCILSLFQPISAQPDLTVTSISISSTSLNRGQLLNVSVTVKNIGTSTTPLSHTGISISPNTSGANAVPLSTVSLESLAAGSSSTLQFVYPIPYNILPGTNYLHVSVDKLLEISESNENNNAFYAGSLLSLSSNKAIAQNLPYPILFVHGLIGSRHAWDTLIQKMQNYYGWSFGGNLSFCLNQDNNLATSNVSNDYHDWTSPTDIVPGDLYTINFNVDQFGNDLGVTNTSLQSNQAGIAKQGYAIRDAIARILQITGRDKVVLVGHSMGGLAAREYLQNSNLYQPDGGHHVAKLYTIGTPHMGSNATMFGIGLTGLDEKSEAVRDLRYSYYSGHPGVYLFGGNENTTDITTATSNFNNVDVNCNGIIGNNIVGLNQKSIPSDLSYSCLIGTGATLGGDGVVAADRADLKLIYPTLVVDTFKINQFALVEFHTDLPKYDLNIKGIDEANEYNHAYSIGFDKTYFGVTTIQSQSPSSYVKDYDDYKFIAGTGSLRVSVYNIHLSQFRVDILNSSYTVIATILSNGRSFLDSVVQLPSGQYYLEVSGVGTNASYFYPYAIKLSFTCAAISTPTIAANGPLSFCQGQNVILTSSYASGNQWFKDGNLLPGGTSQSLNVSSAGIYTVTVSNGCNTSSSLPTAVTVSSISTPSINIGYSGCPSNSILFSSTISNGGTNPIIQWFVNNNFTSTGATYLLSNALNGTQVYATLISNAPCLSNPISNSSPINLSCITTGINSINVADLINVGPIPTKDNLYITFKLRGFKAVSLEVLDNIGRSIIVKNLGLQTGTLSSTLDLTGLSAGVYYLGIRIDKEHVYRKVVVQ